MRFRTRLIRLERTAAERGMTAEDAWRRAADAEHHARVHSDPEVLRLTRQLARRFLGRPDYPWVPPDLAPISTDEIRGRYDERMAVLRGGRHECA